MDLHVGYGSNILDLYSGYRSIESLNAKSIVFQISPDIFYGRLREYFENVHLTSKKILIVVSDKTRLCGYPEYLPVLEKFLTDRASGPITFVIAYGTHPRQSEEESISAYGDIYQRFPFIHHNSSALDEMTEVGTTKRGTRLSVNKVLFEHDVILTFGSISHHYFAGFGGGRKLLFPGLGDQLSVYQNHALYIDKENKQLHPKCQPGLLQGNPLAEDIKEIDGMLPSKFSIHGILDIKGKVRDLIMGKSYSDFENACKVHDGYYKLKVDQLFDMVVASCGGHPKDINFIQAHKAVHNAAAFVRDGGELIIFAECRDGIGSKTFMPYIESGYQAAFEKLVQQYEGNGGTALATFEKTKRIKIHIITSLSEPDCHKMGMYKTTLEGARQKIGKHMGSLAFMENASVTVKA
jgi:lactate racemase